MTQQTQQQQQTAYFVPYFNVKYFEYDQQVGKSADLLSNLVIVDGFFYSAGDTNKFSLGFQYNPDRSEASTIALAKLGYGVGFSRNEVEELFIKSLTQVPIYVLLPNSTKQSQLSSGESQKLFDMSDYIRNTSLPPKKQKSVPHDSLSVRVSFAEPFKITSKGSGGDPTVESPCWCQLTLLKFVDVNVLKSSE